MGPKNLISISQIRQDELSGFLTTATSGLIANLGSHEATGFSVSLLSGVGQVTLSYNTPNIPFISSQVGSSDPNDPFLGSMLYNKNTTGCLVDLTAATNSTNYYLDILISV